MVLKYDVFSFQMAISKVGSCAICRTGRHYEELPRGVPAFRQPFIFAQNNPIFTQQNSLKL